MVIFSMLLKPVFLYAQTGPISPVALAGESGLLPFTNKFTPLIPKGLNIYPDNPLKFDFLLDTGDENFNDKDFKEESGKLIKYFLASMTTPEEEMWVNLSPYEENRVLGKGLEATDMGRDLLKLDYILKQMMASIMYPEHDIGSTYWDKVYKIAYEKYGTTDIPLNTFNKVWIVPESAKVFEHSKGAVIVETNLDVMLESDYLALMKNKGLAEDGISELELNEVKDANVTISKVIKDVLIPELKKEVNHGKTFAKLRQIYRSMILASWFKKKLKRSLLGQVYVDQNKIQGIDIHDTEFKDKVYQQYVQSFQKGEYDIIKDGYDINRQTAVSRRYFSGGLSLNGKHASTESLGQSEAPVGIHKGLTFELNYMPVDPFDGPAMRWSGIGLSLPQEQVVDDVIREYFQESDVQMCVIQLNSKDERYQRLDPSGILEADGVSIYLLKGFLRRIIDLAKMRGIEAPIDMVSHPGLSRKNIYIDQDVYESTLVFKGSEWLTAWSTHELAHIRNPFLVEDEIRQQAPLPVERYNPYQVEKNIARDCLAELDPAYDILKELKKRKDKKQNMLLIGVGRGISALELALTYPNVNIWAVNKEGALWSENVLIETFLNRGYSQNQIDLARLRIKPLVLDIEDSAKRAKAFDGIKFDSVFFEPRTQIYLNNKISAIEDIFNESVAPDGLFGFVANGAFFSDKNFENSKISLPFFERSVDSQIVDIIKKAFSKKAEFVAQRLLGSNLFLRFKRVEEGDISIPLELNYVNSQIIPSGLELKWAIYELKKDAAMIADDPSMNEIFKNLEQVLNRNKDSEAAYQLFILGGDPWAGKTTIANHFQNHLKERGRNAVIVNTDKFFKTKWLMLRQALLLSVLNMPNWIISEKKKMSFFEETLSNYKKIGDFVDQLKKIKGLSHGEEVVINMEAHDPIVIKKDTLVILEGSLAEVFFNKFLPVSSKAYLKFEDYQIQKERLYNRAIRQTGFSPLKAKIHTKFLSSETFRRVFEKHMDSFDHLILVNRGGFSMLEVNKKIDRSQDIQVNKINVAGLKVPIKPYNNKYGWVGNDIPEDSIMIYAFAITSSMYGLALDNAKSTADLKLAIGYQGTPRAEKYAELIAQVTTVQSIHTTISSKSLSPIEILETTSPSLKSSDKFDLAVHITVADNGEMMFRLYHDGSLASGYTLDNIMYFSSLSREEADGRYSKIPFYRDFQRIHPDFIEIVDFKKRRQNQIREAFDIDALKAGVPELLEFLRTKGIQKNQLSEISDVSESISSGMPAQLGDLSLNMDADGKHFEPIVDVNGNLIEPHELALIFASYLYSLGEKGEFLRTNPSSISLSRLGNSLGVETIVVPPGWRNFGEYPDALLSMTSTGHIRFKHGGQYFESSKIAQYLLILEIILKSKMTLFEYLNEVYEKIGPSMVRQFNIQETTQNRNGDEIVQLPMEAFRKNIDYIIENPENFLHNLAQRMGIDKISIISGLIRIGYEHTDKGILNIFFQVPDHPEDDLIVTLRNSTSEESVRIYVEASTEKVTDALLTLVVDSISEMGNNFEEEDASSKELSLEEIFDSLTTRIRSGFVLTSEADGQIAELFEKVMSSQMTGAEIEEMLGINPEVQRNENDLVGESMTYVESNDDPNVEGKTIIYEQLEEVSSKVVKYGFEIRRLTDEKAIRLFQGIANLILSESEDFFNKQTSAIKISIGYQSESFREVAELMARVLTANGIKVNLADAPSHGYAIAESTQRNPALADSEIYDLGIHIEGRNIYQLANFNIFSSGIPYISIFSNIVSSLSNTIKGDAFFYQIYNNFVNIPDSLLTKIDMHQRADRRLSVFEDVNILDKLKAFVEEMEAKGVLRKGATDPREVLRILTEESRLVLGGFNLGITQRGTIETNIKDIDGREAIVPFELAAIIGHFLHSKGEIGIILKSAPAPNFLHVLALALGVKMRETGLGVKEFLNFPEAFLAFSSAGHIHFRYKDEYFFSSALALQFLVLQILVEKKMTLSQYLQELYEDLGRIIAHEEVIRADSILPDGTPVVGVNMVQFREGINNLYQHPMLLDFALEDVFPGEVIVKTESDGIIRVRVNIPDQPFTPLWIAIRNSTTDEGAVRINFEQPEFFSMEETVNLIKMILAKLINPPAADDFNGGIDLKIDRKGDDWAMTANGGISLNSGIMNFNIEESSENNVTSPQYYQALPIVNAGGFLPVITNVIHDLDFLSFIGIRSAMN